ncbi:MAG: SMC family ATPase [Lachnospiraceae bacterium]|nr:SMC family ATPase [Lachnospiraceae bacterium]
MKPIYLKMKAFGSYKDEHIDFSNVQQGVFLITGDTGAGKTTIFDAITYALYGESSGGKRDSKMMVSQFADYGEYTEVEFAFFYGKDRYNVRRSPEQPKFREKKGEDGTIIYEQLKTTKKPEVELTLPNGEIYIGKLNETNKKIQEIIGIDAAQFTQIAMLAQGDFLKLLHAKSDERKDIFSKIFDTHFYYAIEKEIENCFKECESQLKENEKEIETCLRNIVCCKNSSIKEEWEDKGTFSIDRKEEILQFMEEIQKEYEQLACQNKKKKEECDKKRDELQKSIHDAEVINKDFDDLKAAKEKQAELESKKEQIEENKKKINKGEKALKVAGSYFVYHDKKKIFKQKHKTIEQLQNNLEKKRESLEPLEQKKIETDQKYEEEFPKKIEEASRLEGKLGLYGEIEEFQKTYEKEHKEFITKEKMQKKKEKEQIEEEKKAGILEKEIEQLLELAGKKDTINGQVEKISREKEDFEDFLRLLKTEEDFQEQQEKQLKKYEEVKNTRKDSEENYNRLYHNFISSQAYILRASLVEGEPCPVCGSTHHFPMPQENVEVVGQEEVNYAKGVLEKAAKREQTEKGKLQEIIVRREENYRLLKERGNKLHVPINELCNISIDKYYNNNEFCENLAKLYQIAVEKMEKQIKKLEEQLEDYQKKKQQAEQAAECLEEKQQEKRKNKEELEEVGKLLFQLGKEIAGLKSSLTNKEEILSHKRTQLPFPTKKETVEYLEKLKKQQNELASNKKLAEDNYQIAADEVKKLAATLETELKAQDVLKEEEKQTKEDFEKQLQKQGFTSEEKFLEAKITDDKLETLKTIVAQYEKNIQENQTNVVLLTERTKDKKPMDIKQYQKEIAEVQKEIQIFEKEDKEIYSQKQANEKSKNIVQKKYQEMEDNSFQYTVLKSLHDTANGKLSKKKMDFQTYIQRHYFKQVIYAANERLKTMSNNQFILQCRKLENLGTQGNVGLDIDVYSLVNDQSRDVKTLSGGESFMAALSMALGLSDIIQSKAGKIKIETMFIDEGFGSLSDDTRNQALSLLHKLTEGNRLIGIISHVSELKSQVDTRLAVTKTNHGSKARWI